MAIGTAMRMAGPKLFQFLTKNVPKEELAIRLGMDALGGGMNAFYTPGDIGDKTIAALTDTLFSAGGGLLLGKFGGKGFGGTALDFVGSVGGSELGRRLGDQIQRGKDLAMGASDRDWETSASTE